MKMLSIIVVLVFLMVSGFAQQEENFKFKHINTDNSESNQWIRCIYQDKQGYIWLGTADGLNRFDGYDIVVYRPVDQNKKPLGTIKINAILEKNENELWVATDVGIYIFDYRKDSLLQLPIIRPMAVLNILKDNKGIIWFGSENGVYKYNPADSVLTNYYSKADKLNTLSNNYVNVLFQDSRSNIWVGTYNGLNLFRQKTDDFIRYISSTSSNSISGNNIISITQDANQNLWFGTSQNGLNVANITNDSMVNFTKVLDGNITHMLIDYEGYLWVGRSSNQGMVRMDIKNYVAGKSIPTIIFKNNPYNDVSINDNSIFSIYEDHAKDLWFGSFNNGVSFYSKRERKFFNVFASVLSKDWIKNSRVNAFLEEDRYFWVGTEGGLDRFDKKTKNTKHFNALYNDSTSLGSNTVNAIYKDSRGNLWIGTWEGGLNLFDYKTETFKRYLASDRIGSISSNNVYTILEDAHGNLWVGTLGGGLNKFDYSTSTFKHYLPKEGDSISKNLMTRYVNHIFETSDGKLLVSTYNSIDLYNPGSDDFTHYTYSSSAGNKIVSIFEDSRKNIWLGTNTGLTILNLSRGVIEPYIAGKDLTDLSVQAIQEDHNENLWVSTNNGIYKLLSAINFPDSLAVRHFSKNDGLPENEFIKRSTYKDSSGILYFGSAGGYTYFNPDSIFTNKIIPQVILTELQLLISQKNKGNRYIPIEGNINYIEEIELAYKDRNFTIQFAALSYLHPEENQYQYMLEGYDADWIDVDNQRKATYTNILAGKYTFMVKACNNDGVWCEQPKTIKIIIHPPWWGTIWFRTLVILLLIILLISLYRYRFSYLESQKRILQEKIKGRTTELLNMNTLLEEKQEEIIVQNVELEKHRNNLEAIVEERTFELIKAKKEAEESNRLKSSFLANMSHEIRTPMNAISGFSQLLTDESIDKTEKEHFITNINRNCDTLKVLIDDIIDISLIEANQLKIIKNPFDVVPIMQSIESYFSIANDKNILFKFIENPDVKDLNLNNDVIRFRQVITNLISNAFKYTEKGSIRFGYEILNGPARFFVSDTGIGIEKSELDKIFQSFYKVENNPNILYRGAGIGLAICQNLVNLMGGSIWAESEISKGSTFYFTLPITKNMQPIKNQSTIDLNAILPKLENFTLLVAEDEPSNFDLVNVLLKRYVSKIIWARNGIEAVEFIKANPQIENCIVLMDIKMPSLDGYEAHKQIRKINPQIPVIAVTAFALSSDKQRLMNENFDAFIFKPIKKEDLIETVARFAVKVNH